MPRLLTHNWAWKLAALVCSAALWFFVVGEPELVTVEAVPLVYWNLPSGLVLLSDPPDTIRLELRGPSREITRGNLSGLKVLLDFSSVDQPGQRTFAISALHLNLPEGVSFLRAVPSQLLLSFDRMESREIPVSANLKGSPPQGFRALAPMATPTTVRVTGPATQVSSLEVLDTDPVDVSGKTASFEAKLQPALPEPGLKIDPPVALSAKITIEKGNSLRE